MSSRIIESLPLLDTGSEAEKRSAHWFFTRGDQTVELTVYGEASDRYDIEIRWPNGRQEWRRFFSLDSTRLNLLRVEWQLQNSGFRFDRACFTQQEHH